MVLLSVKDVFALVNQTVAVPFDASCWAIPSMMEIETSLGTCRHTAVTKVNTKVCSPK